MGYLHINNLYKEPDIFLFKEIFALEKIHGTSSNISYNDGILTYFSGGVKHEDFVKLFNSDFLLSQFKEVYTGE